MTFLKSFPCWIFLEIADWVRLHGTLGLTGRYLKFFICRSSWPLVVNMVTFIKVEFREIFSTPKFSGGG